MSNTEKLNTGQAEKFYAALAPGYDQMTRFSARSERERPLLRQWVKRLGWKTVVDAGCGTGIHAVLLAADGLTVTGVDPSAELLAKAREHATAVGVTVNWVQGVMQELPELGPADAVLCLGNVIPHLLDEDALLQTLRAFAAVTVPGGRVLIQLLNYARILRERQRMVGATRNEGVEFVRFYDFIDPLIRFNVLQLDWQGDRAEHRLSSTIVRPYTADDLRSALRQCGWQDINLYTGLDRTPFKPDANSLLLVATRH